ncbi:MAG: hypothetical protein AB7H71_05730 [Alphaproteobacteria bacterium]
MIAPRPSGNPFQDMCTMIGLMTLTWAWAENSLAMTIGVIIEHTGPVRGHKEAPLSLSRRIDCLKIALREIENLKPLQQEGRALATRFTELGRRRHDIIHGAAWQLQESQFESISIGVKAGNYTVTNHSFNVGDTVSLNTEITKLQDDITTFMLKVVAVLQT